MTLVHTSDRLDLAARISNLNRATLAGAIRTLIFARCGNFAPLTVVTRLRADADLLGTIRVTECADEPYFTKSEV